MEGVPQENVQGRVVLVLDDVLHEGITLAAIRERVMSHGAAAFYRAPFLQKGYSPALSQSARILLVSCCRTVYAFGFGMDIHGAWRNLPAIYALKD